MKTKKLACAVMLSAACVAALLCGCGQSGNSTSNETLQKMSEANDFDSLVEKYGKVEYLAEDIYSDGYVDEYYIYQDAGTYFIGNDIGGDICENGEFYGYRHNEDSELIPHGLLCINGMEEDYMNSMKWAGIFTMDPNENVISEETSDGVKLVKTSQTQNYEYYAESFDYEEGKVSGLYSEYKIDEATYEVIEYSTYLVIDGENVLCSYRAKCDSVEDVNFDDVRNAVYSADSRTVTVITDAGTADEKSYTKTVGKGCAVSIVAGDDFERAVYEDPDCTTLHSDDYSSDNTVYLKRVQ